MQNKPGMINWTAVIIIAIWLLVVTSIVFSYNAWGQKKPAALTIKETYAIKMMARKIHQTKAHAEACLTELLIIKARGAQCAIYEKIATKLHKWSVLVNKIERNRRYWFIAHNNMQYTAFNKQDELDSIVNQINSYEKK